MVFFLALTFAALLAEAAPQQPPRLVPEKGRAYRIESAVLGETRRVFVQLPASFDRSAASRRYPTMIAFDGESMLTPLATASDFLAREGQIPESVLVAIESPNSDRGRVHDLTPPGLSVSGSGLDEGGDRMLDFIQSELLPAIDAQFRAAAPRVLVGHSSGGVLVTYAAATRDSFRFALALDTPIHLGDGWLAKKLLERTRNPAPRRYVSLEARFGWSDASWKSLTTAAPATWLLHREKLVHESHNSMRLLGAYIGLRELFCDYSMLAAPEAPTTSILPYYEKLAASYGAPIVAPEPLLRQVIDDLLMEGRGAAARAVFETLTSSYGERSDAAALQARIAETSRRPAPKETVEELLATPFPTPVEARDYLGEWEGEEWIDEAAKNRFVLRIAEEEGKVIATKIASRGAAGTFTQPIQVLRVTPAGLTFVFMNGMRPRGVVLFEAQRDGDTLRGEMRFGGISITPAAGEEMPKLRFTMRRKASS